MIWLSEVSLFIFDKGRLAEKTDANGCSSSRTEQINANNLGVIIVAGSLLD